MSVLDIAAMAPAPMAPVPMVPRVANLDDVLAELSDSFSRGASLTGNGWAIEDTSPSSSPSDTIAAGAADLEVAAGGTGGSFWFDTNEGALWYKTITGPVDFRARVRVTNAAGTDLPPVTQFRVAGIAAHDPDRTTLEYLHIGLGSNNSAALQVEWKTTDASDSAYGYTEATLTGGSLLYDLRIVRRATDLQVFDLYVRAGTARTLDDNEGWTLEQTIDRSDADVPDRAANNGSVAVELPQTLRYGPMLYANAEAHDLRMYMAAALVASTTD